MNILLGYYISSFGFEIVRHPHIDVIDVSLGLEMLWTVTCDSPTMFPQR